MEYIKETYSLPFLKRGLKILFDNKEGIVIGSHAAYIKVKFENGEINTLHPTWNIAYFSGEKLLKDFRQ